MTCECFKGKKAGDYVNYPEEKLRELEARKIMVNAFRDGEFKTIGTDKD